MSSRLKLTNSSRLIGLMLLLILYSIASTSFFTKWLLLPYPIVSDAFLKDEVFVLDETDSDGSDSFDSDDAEDDDEEETANESSEQQISPYECNTENAPDFLPENDTIRRSLHGVIIGTQKGGTQALHTILLTHPKILTSSTGHGELHFFNRYYLRMVDRSSHIIPRQKTRTAFFKALKDPKGFTKKTGKHKIVHKRDITDPSNGNKVAFHSAPLYLFSGRKVPARMLCTAPWIKVIAILRNPIERAYSHYHFIYPEKRKTDTDPTFEEFILKDIDRLKQYGVLNNVTGFTTYSGSTEEYAAWERYVSVARSDGPIGRGLYSIQLEIWMDEFKKYNKSVSDDLLLLQSESSREYPQESYHSTVQFLGLEPRKVQKHKNVFAKDHHATNYSGSDGLSEETYRMLYELYEPYNRRLYSLLGSEWEGVWDDTNADTLVKAQR